MVSGPGLIGPGYFFSKHLVFGPGPSEPGPLFVLACHFGECLSGPFSDPVV